MVIQNLLGFVVFFWTIYHKVSAVGFHVHIFANKKRESSWMSMRALLWVNVTSIQRYIELEFIFNFLALSTTIHMIFFILRRYNCLLYSSENFEMTVKGAHNSTHWVIEKFDDVYFEGVKLFQKKGCKFVRDDPL